jgi:TonB family protein
MPAVLEQTKPIYPQDAFEKSVEGVVDLMVLIGEDGAVQRMAVVRSVPLLDAAAVNCVRNWRFKPASRDGRPIPVVARVPITFRTFGRRPAPR